jgi:hypothetical protein
MVAILSVGTACLLKDFRHLVPALENHKGARALGV